MRGTTFIIIIIIIIIKLIIFITEREQKIYFPEDSQGVTARPSGKGRLVAR